MAGEPLRLTVARAVFSAAKDWYDGLDGRGTAPAPAQFRRARTLLPRQRGRVDAEVVARSVVRFAHERRERAWLILCDRDSRWIRGQQVAHGAEAHATISLAKIARLTRDARGAELVFVAHSHPRDPGERVGDATPSGTDLAFTFHLRRHLEQATDARLVDHVVVAWPQRAFSIVQNCEIDLT